MKEIPKSFVAGPGEEGKLISGIVDDFFKETVDFIADHYNADKRDFCVDSGRVTYCGSVISDNKITHLTYAGNRVVAGVLETRTEFNNVQYTFFRSLGCLDDLDFSILEG